jgi:methionine sulfoxide reductase heme-binding subunit
MQPHSRSQDLSFVATGVLVISLSAVVGVVAAATAGMSISPLTWYVARSAGLVTYLLFWLSVATGLGMTTKLLPFVGRNGEKWDIHRLATELAFVALAAHLVSLALDPTVPLGLIGVLIPMTSDVRQPWADLGIIAGYGLIITGGSYGLRSVLGYHGWRMMHYLALPMWFIALLHGIGAGSDSQALPVIVMYVVTSGLIVYLTMLRLLAARTRGNGPVALAPTVRNREQMRHRVAEYRRRQAALQATPPRRQPRSRLVQTQAHDRPGLRAARDLDESSLLKR